MQTAPAPREPQYAPCFDEPPVTLGPMTGATWRWNPRRLGFVLARYKFVAQMIKGAKIAAEIGCADGFPSVVVREAVDRLDLFDFDAGWVAEAEKHHPGRVRQWDITRGPLWKAAPGTLYDAIYMLDVLEHIQPAFEKFALANVVASLNAGGVFIAGVPSLESQRYASDISKAGHVNCRTGERVRDDLSRYFDNVFLFGMNDEVLHTGFPAMCHYLFALCTGPQPKE